MTEEARKLYTMIRLVHTRNITTLSRCGERNSGSFIIECERSEPIVPGFLRNLTLDPLVFNTGKAVGDCSAAAPTGPFDNDPPNSIRAQRMSVVGRVKVQGPHIDVTFADSALLLVKRLSPRQVQSVTARARLVSWMITLIGLRHFDFYFYRARKMARPNQGTQLNADEVSRYVWASRQIHVNIIRDIYDRLPHSDEFASDVGFTGRSFGASSIS